MEQSIEASAFVLQGEMLVNSDALDPLHPESWAALWRAKYGEDLPLELSYPLYGTSVELAIVRTQEQKAFEAEEMWNNYVC